MSWFSLKQALDYGFSSTREIALAGLKIALCIVAKSKQSFLFEFSHDAVIDHIFGHETADFSLVRVSTRMVLRIPSRLG